MQEFDNVKDMVYCEIDEISHYGKLDMNSVKILGELVDILKDIGQIEMFEDGIQVQDDEYSYGYSRNNGYSQRRMPIYYDRGNSYGYRNSRNGYPRRNHGGYSYDESKDQMIEKLNHLMMESNDQKDKESIQRLIEQMENN